MRTLAGLLTLFVTANLFAHAAITPASAEDLKKFQGLWKPDSVVADGEEKLPDAKQRALLTLVVKEGEYRLYVATDAAKDEHMRLLTADIVLDADTKSFTLTVKDGLKKGAKLHGIYALEGDKLKLCYGPAEKPRPTKFEAPKGSELMLEVWGREKK